MRPNLDAPLRNREPEPGLLNLPIPLPDIPVVSPLISPLVAGSNQQQQQQPSSAPKPNPAPAPSPAPAPPPPRPAPAPAPSPAPAPAPGPGSGNQNGGSQRGGESSHSGGSDGGSGSSNGNNGGSGASQGSNLGNQDGNGSGGSSGSQQNSNGTPTSSGGSSSVAAAGAPADAPVSVIGGSTFLVTPTGLVPQPANNAVANAASDPSGSGSVSNDPSRQSSPSGSSSSATLLDDPAQSAGAGLAYTTVGSSSMAGGFNGGSTNGSGGSGAASQSHLSAGAKGGIAAAILIVVFGIALFILRKRYKRRKDERRVEWINGYISGDNGSAPDMLQRSNSKRSSWGTPFEYRISNAFRRSVVSSHSDDQAYDYVVSPPSPYYDYDRSASGAPVLPMPVHSPTQVRAHSPEDPFADGLAQPLRRMSSLPLRLSIISSASGHEDPFDDHNTPPTAANNRNPAPPDSPASSATFGPGTRNIAFPLPPPSTGSTRDTVNTLLTPGIMISFPDSPISPSFAASGTSSYPRRATVQQSYIPTSRRDEVRVNQGDSVSVVSVYEDGWAFVQREEDNERGLMPLSHLAM